MSLANMPPLLPKFEESETDGSLSWRATLDIRIAPDEFKNIARFVGVDLGKSTPTDNKISETMDF